MAPFDRSNTTFYWSAIVNIGLSGTVFELFDVEWYRDLEIWVRGHSRSFKMVPFESFGAVFYSPSTVTVALSCKSSEIKRDIGWKSWFFYTIFVFDALVRGVPVGILPSCLVRKNWNGGATRRWKKLWEYVYSFRHNTGVWRTDGRTDRRTDILPRHSPRYAYASRGKNRFSGIWFLLLS